MIENLFKNATHAQTQWTSFAQTKQTHLFKQLTECLIDSKNSIVQTIHEETRKPVFEALSGEIIPVLETLKFIRKNGRKILKPKSIPMGMMKHRSSKIYPQPLGINLIISPWNFPFFLPAAEVVFSAFAGNSTILKPSEFTPKSGKWIEELFRKAGFPEGLVQCVQGDGKMGSDLIAARPAKIFFTGSVATGIKIMRQASENLIPVNLEMGGKDAFIVLEDADLDLASSAALWGMLYNTGQACASTERIYAHESIYAEFKNLLKNKISRLIADHRSSIGAFTTEAQERLVRTQIEKCKADNTSKLEMFLDSPPVGIVEVLGNSTATIYREETFGPLATLSSFRQEDEVIKYANDSAYGLLASIYTRNINKGISIAKKIQAGSVLVNEVLYTASLPETPWGGLKNTGFGKKHSAEGLKEFVQWKHIHTPKRGIPEFKSLWWYPYSDTQYRAYDLFTELYRSNRLRKMMTLIKWLAATMGLLIREKRI